MLVRAAEEGGPRALSDVGLGGKDTVLTIHDMRSLLACIQFARRTAVQTAVNVITTGVLIALRVPMSLYRANACVPPDRTTRRPAPQCSSGTNTLALPAVLMVPANSNEQEKRELVDQPEGNVVRRHRARAREQQAPAIGPGRSDPKPQRAELTDVAGRLAFFTEAAKDLVNTPDRGQSASLDLT